MADNSARKPLEEMTTEEKVTEILTTMRALEDAVEMLSQNPMLGAFMGGGNPMEALMRG